jgi:hypothetical protein
MMVYNPHYKIIQIQNTLTGLGEDGNGNRLARMVVHEHHVRAQYYWELP